MPAVVVFVIVPALCVRSPAKVTVPTSLSVNVPADHAIPALRRNAIDPDETLMVWVLVEEMVTVPSMVADCAPTTNVMIAATLLGLMLKFPVPPPAVVVLKLPPAPTVRVVAVAVALPTVREAQTAAASIVRLTPEFMTTSSVLSGTWPRLHVAPAQVVPAEAVFVAACALTLPRRTSIREQKTSKVQTS